MTSPQPQPQPQAQTPTPHIEPPAPPQPGIQAEETHTPQAQEPPTEHHGGRVVHLHTAYPRVPIPYVTPGDMFTNARKATSTAASMLPSPRRLAFYGLLGGMSAVGAMAWPVAFAVGAATEVITREQAARQHEEHERIERERTERERIEREQAGQSVADRTETGTPRQTAMG